MGHQPKIGDAAPARIEETQGFCGGYHISHAKKDWWCEMVEESFILDK
jgi:hypothetical protein